MSALLTLVLLAPAQAADAKPIVKRAIEAHGGAEKLSRQNAVREKIKGTIDIMGMQVEFSGSAVYQLPAQTRQEVALDIMGNRVEVVQVYNNGKGWSKTFGQLKELGKDELERIKADLQETRLLTLVPLLEDPNLQLAVVGEEKVDDKPAIGIKVSAKGHKDIDLYFDKASGLAIRSVRMVQDPATGREVKRETIFLEFKERDGLKYATRFKILQDGARFIEGELTELELLDKVDEKEFSKPGKDA